MVDRHRAGYAKEYREKNRDRINANHKAYRLRNREKVSERKHKYYIEHKEAQLTATKKYREEHREKFNEYSRAWRKRHHDKWLKRHKEYQKRYIENNPEVSNAHREVNGALAHGEIERLPCEICGREKAEAHHCDYSKPLEVMWLCKKHHAEWHRNNKPIKKGD